MTPLKVREVREEEVPEWAVDMVRLARMNFERDGFLSPVAFLLNTGQASKKSGDSDPVEMSVYPLPPGASTEVVDATIRQLAMETHADEVLLITEAWRLQGGDTDDVGPGKFEQVTDHPNREAVLHAQLETRTAYYMVQFPVEQPKSDGGLPTLAFADWVEIPKPDVKGMMSGYLPPLGF